MTRSSQITFNIITLGCSKNYVDSEYLKASLVGAGYVPAGEDPAHLTIINTCGFITPAKEESLEIIFDALEQADEHNGRVAVVGCLSQRYLDAIRTDIPELDFVFGLVDDNLVPAMSLHLGIQLEKNARMATRLPLLDQLPHAYLKIAEGCSNNCTYCSIPLIRGPYRPFKRERLLRETRDLADRGAIELNIISQDTTLYRDGTYSLVDLLKELDQVEGLEWIRLLYCHPDHLASDLLKAFTIISKLVPYIDIPFQHVNEDILRGMGRKGSFDIYRDLVYEIRDLVPDMAIRTTFMTGFPGEEDHHFNELLQFIEETKLDRVGVFTFSPEEGTPAAGREHPPVDVAESRRDELMSLQQSISADRLARLVGREVPVLVEVHDHESLYLGRTPWDAPEVDGIFFLTGDNLTLNTIVPARVTNSTEYDLTGVAL